MPVKIVNLAIGIAASLWHSQSRSRAAESEGGL
jgi:hypothetical protein